MTTLVWILVFGLLMCLLSLIGGVALLLPEPILRRLLMPSVALAAGSLIGGALFHMLPEAADHAHGDVSVWIWVAAGFALFGVLEQFLHWHHCHRPPSEHHQPLTWLLLIADAVHNFVGGLAVGGAFLIDIRVGVVAWVAAAAHEIPQELGDFGVLLHGGWKPARALLFNALSALTFPIGGVLAWALSSGIDVSITISTPGVDP